MFVIVCTDIARMYMSRAIHASACKRKSTFGLGTVVENCIFPCPPKVRAAILLGIGWLAILVRRLVFRKSW
jgi:hypothetical protein